MKRIALLMLIAAFVLGGCRSEPSPLPAADLPAVLAYADPQAEASLSAIQAKDFEKLTENFNPIFKRIMGEDNFKQMVTALETMVGTCQDKKFAHAEDQGSSIAVTYTLRCSKDPVVEMQIVFDADEFHRIAGLFFNSPALQK